MVWDGDRACDAANEYERPHVTPRPSNETDGAEGRYKRSSLRATMALPVYIFSPLRASVLPRHRRSRHHAPFSSVSLLQ